jgi:arylformamidase
MPGFPGNPVMGVLTQSKAEVSGWNETVVVFDMHTGTHMDAPYHVLNEGLTVDNVPLETFMGDTIVADLRYKKAKEEILPGDLESSEAEIRRLRRVILNTGWHKQFGKKGTFYYTHPPELTVETAKWLTERKVILLGLDLPAPARDNGNHKVHVELFKNGILAVYENLTNLDKLRKKVVYFMGLPLPYAGREGSPVRAIAIED